MPEPTNADRAKWGEEALKTFCDRTGLKGTDVKDCGIGDLIADLMHLAASWGLNPHEEIARGIGHYEDEVAEEAEEEEAEEAEAGEPPPRFPDVADDESRSFGPAGRPPGLTD